MAVDTLYPNNLKYWIKKQGYRLSEVADYLKISSRTLTDYCAGRLAMSHDKLEAVATLLDCPPSVLLESPTARPAGGLFFVEGDEMKMRRRDVLRLLTIASGALALPVPLLDFERIEAAIARPRLLDETAVLHLEGVNTHYWGIYRAAANKASVLDGAQGHFKTLTAALQDAHADRVHKRLCAVASDLAQLIGEIYFDLRDYTAAQSCYTFAVAAARSGGHADLLACAYARNSYLPIYDESFADALPLVQAGRAAAAAGDSQLAVRQWVESIAAETFAGLYRSDDCRAALDAASSVVDVDTSRSPAWLRFEGGRLPALRGACFVRLHEPQAALPSLSEALAVVPGPVRRRAMILTDMGLAAAQQGNVEQACGYGIEAGQIAIGAGSAMLGAGLRKLRVSLEPYKGASALTKFDKQLQLLR
jgi:transcriptional regulator with XRE-family HTH domain